MSDQNPLEPTRVDTDAVGEPTMVQPAAGEPPTPTDPPPGGPPPGDGDDGGDNRDRNMKIAIGGVVVLILVLLGVLFLTDDDDASVETADPTTSSTTTTTEAATTSTEAPTTTASSTTTSTTEDTTPPTSTCSGKDAPPDDPSPIAKTFMDSWQLDDRPCAEAIATDGAVNTMFAVEPGPTPQDFFGCSPVDDGTSDPHNECVFGFEGGTTNLKMNFGAIDGWRVFEVSFVAD